MSVSKTVGRGSSPWRDANMLQIVNNILSKQQCEEIINISKHVDKWFVIEQGMVKTETIKCYIKPKIEHILKNIPFNLEESTCVELLKYDTGSCSKLHMDTEGTHVLGIGNFIVTEWKQTAIINLNDNFSGGVLSFPKLGKTFNSIGDMIIFPAGKNSYDYEHEVSEVTSGIRYTLVFRFI